MSEVMDLNDLIKSIVFTVSEKNYEVPPMNDAKMKKVMGFSKDISNLSSEERKDPLTDEEEAELLDLQNTILSECVSLKGEDDKLKQVSKAKFAEWPMKLKNKVLEIIFNQLGSGEVEKETEKN